MTDLPFRYVYWVRNDLRLHDNRTLNALLEHRAKNTPNAPVAVWISGPPGWNEAAPWGWSRFSDRRKSFWHESARAFSEGLRHLLEARVELRWGTLPFQTSENGLWDRCAHVFASLGHGWEEAQEELQVQTRIAAHGATFHGIENHDLWEPRAWKFSLDRLPPTFTGFRKKVEGLEPQIPESIAPDSPLPAHPTSTPEAHPKTSFPFAGDEGTARAHVHRFIWETDGLARYKETRNGLIGVPYSGKISPWLATGALSVRWVWHEVRRFERERGATEGSEWFRLELLWRSYFLWAARIDGARLFGKQPLFNVERSTPFQKWSTGTTPDDFVNAGMRELVETGYLSNRMRQNVASYFIHNLHLPWAVGASFFEHHLLDYETGSNWGNWAYIAGTGRTPGRRPPFQTAQQAAWYDPHSEYRAYWLNK